MSLDSNTLGIVSIVVSIVAASTTFVIGLYLGKKQAEKIIEKVAGETGQHILDALKLSDNPRFSEAKINENGQMVVPVGRTFVFKHNIEQAEKKTAI